MNGINLTQVNSLKIKNLLKFGSSLGILNNEDR